MLPVDVSYELFIKSLTDRIKEFYPKLKVYNNRVIGDMITPCFVIHTIQNSAVKIKPNLYNCINTMDIRYYSDQPKNQIDSDMDKVSFMMLEVLSELYVNDMRLKIENDRVYCEKVEDVLHCFVNYKYSASSTVVDTPAFKDLNLDADLKKEV